MQSATVACRQFCLQMAAAWEELVVADPTLPLAFYGEVRLELSCHWLGLLHWHAGCMPVLA